LIRSDARRRAAPTESRSAGSGRNISIARSNGRAPSRLPARTINASLIDLDRGNSSRNCGPVSPGTIVARPRTDAVALSRPSGIYSPARHGISIYTAPSASRADRPASPVSALELLLSDNC